MKARCSSCGELIEVERGASSVKCNKCGQKYLVKFIRSDVAVLKPAIEVR